MRSKRKYTNTNKMVVSVTIRKPRVFTTTIRTIIDKPKFSPVTKETTLMSVTLVGLNYTSEDSRIISRYYMFTTIPYYTTLADLYVSLDTESVTKA
ncbi:unnamed protein product, partial [Trichogramma brassicae]